MYSLNGRMIMAPPTDNFNRFIARKIIFILVNVVCCNRARFVVPPALCVFLVFTPFGALTHCHSAVRYPSFFQVVTIFARPVDFIGKHGGRILELSHDHLLVLKWIF